MDQQQLWVTPVAMSLLFLRSCVGQKGLKSSSILGTDYLEGVLRVGGQWRAEAR